MIRKSEARGKKPRKMAARAPAEVTAKQHKPINRTPVRNPPVVSGAGVDEDRIVTSNLSLHELFQQQSTHMLERADLTEEQKQSILIGMSCPCCGAGGFSFTAKLRR